MRRSFGFLVFLGVISIARMGWGNSRTYTQTEYPIVLAHGMLGFENIAGVLDYWYAIADALQYGGATVFVTEVSGLHSPEMRGEQLLAQIETITALTGKQSVNIIAHSHGAFDARYVAGVHPDLVASVTSVGGPNKGSEVADYIRSHVHEGEFSEELLAFFGDSLATILALLAGTAMPQDTIAAIDSVTTEGAAKFNARYPQGVPETSCGEGDPMVDGIRYYSWSGNKVVTNVFDPLDPAFLLASVPFTGTCDGLVGRCSSHLGKVIRDDYRHNHLDEVNLMWGMVNWFESKPQALFRAHANRLKRAGL